MKPLFNFFLVLLQLSFLLSCGQKSKAFSSVDNPATSANAAESAEQTEKATVIYLVRHAEKVANSPTDPDLSSTGKTRAQALKDSLSNQPVTAIYSTAFKRTIQTAAPLAAAKKIQVQTYDAQNLQALANKVLTDDPHQTVLIVGHSNTVLETLEAFKANRPIPKITDSDYNYLFKLTLQENQKPKIEVKRYGAN